MYVHICIVVFYGRNRICIRSSSNLLSSIFCTLYIRTYVIPVKTTSLGFDPSCLIYVSLFWILDCDDVLVVYLSLNYPLMNI